MSKRQTKQNKPEQKQVVIAPASPKQEMYINATQDVVVFGGGAG